MTMNKRIPWICKCVRDGLDLDQCYDVNDSNADPLIVMQVQYYDNLMNDLINRGCGPEILDCTSGSTCMCGVSNDDDDDKATRCKTDAYGHGVCDDATNQCI